MFGGVLILLVRFAVPSANNVVMEDVLDLASNLDHSTITEKLRGCSLCADVVLQSVDKFLVSLGTIDICEERLCANEKLGMGGPGINSKSIRDDLVGGNRFRMSMDIGGRERSAVPFRKIGTSRHACILHSHFESLLDDVGGQPGKKGMKGLVIRSLDFDIMGMQ